MDMDQLADRGGMEWVSKLCPVKDELVVTVPD